MKRIHSFVFALSFCAFLSSHGVAQKQNSLDSLNPKKIDSMELYQKQFDDTWYQIREINADYLGYPKDTIDYYTNRMLATLPKIKKNDSIFLLVFYDLSIINIYMEKERALQDSVTKYGKREENYIYLSGNHLNISDVYVRDKEYNKAIKESKLALKYARLGNFISGTSNAYYNIGRYYKQLKFDSISRKMTELAYTSLDLVKNEKGYEFASYVYRMALMEYWPSEKAASFAEEAVPVVKKISHDNRFLSFIYVNLGGVYLKEKKYDKAFEVFREVEKIDTYDMHGMISSLCFANYYIETKDFEKARKHFENFRIFSLKTDDIVKVVSTVSYYFDTNEMGNTIYTQTKEYDKATYYANKYIEFQRNLLRQKEEGLLEEFAIKFDVEQKEKELALADLKIEKEKQNNLLFIAFFSIVSLITLGLFILYQRKRKYKLSLLEKEIQIKEQRTQFFENVFHEIRTPMTIIGGYLNLIHKNTLTPNLVSKYSEIGIRNCQEITSSSNDFLALIKSEKAQQEVRMTEQSLVDFITKLLLKYKENMSLKQISLMYDSNIEKGLELRTDYDKVEKILNNLMMNAIKYSPANTQITFSSQIENQTLIFKVQDQGYGIPESELKYIFERFYQISSNELINGVGIGLSLVKNFVNLLGGSIDVESSLGKGSLFTISLPVEIENVSGFVKDHMGSSLITLDEVSIEKKKEQQNLPKLLLVEDNYEMTQYVKELLNPYYHVDISLSAINALKRLKEQSYQVIVSDFRMPEMNGLEFKEILNETQHKDTPFIMITASTLSENKKKSLALGINDYLVKPFQDIELITRIQFLLGNKELQVKYLRESIQEKEESTINTNYDDVVKQAQEIIVKNLSDETFSIQKLAQQCNYSPRQFTRVIKNCTGLNPNKLVLEVRLLTAYELIVSNKEKRIKQVMFDVGINSYGYFNKVFTQRFGLKPIDLIHRSS